MKVLIALDESPVSRRAAREAVRLFQAAAPEFLVISVTPSPSMPFLGVAYGQVVPLAIDGEWMVGVEEPKESVLDRAEEAGVPDPVVETDVGDPVTLICNAADDHDVDVVVVGSHDKSALRRIFDPSVAAGVVRGTHRPVLVVSGDEPVSIDR